MKHQRDYCWKNNSYIYIKVYKIKWCDGYSMTSTRKEIYCPKNKGCFTLVKIPKYMCCQLYSNYIKLIRGNTFHQNLRGGNESVSLNTRWRSFIRGTFKNFIKASLEEAEKKGPRSGIMDTKHKVRLEQKVQSANTRNGM